MSRTLEGRADLHAWLAAQPADFFAADADFDALVALHGLDARRPALHAAGQAVAGPLDAAVRENNLHANLPVLDDWDAVGAYTGRVRHHPRWREAGRLIYGTGVMAAYGASPVPHRFILSLFYLTSQAGEAGHNCPLACNAGAIRTLQAVGTPAQQAAYLPRLLDPSFDHTFTASQFLTEVQGGSDVGANALRATPAGPGAEAAGGPWRIHGEKWFCSNADADLFLVTARPEGGAEGTRGLGLFLIPRLRADGRPNGFRLRRLKDKLGTRSMASAEIDFDGAEATALGPVEHGFRTVMERVINTSRVYNILAVAAHARRASVVAATYAAHRRAFGQPIGEFAVVRETLAWMRADAAALLAIGLALAGQQEAMDAGTLGPDEGAFFRVALNLAKSRTAALAHEVINRGIEVLGGNGAIESFSVLPRLLRDNVVCENWEGTHNVLRAQVLRDCARMGLHEGFFRVLAARLGPDPRLSADAAAFSALLQAPEALRDIAFRPLADRLATWAMLWALAPAPALADHAALHARHLGPLPLDDAYLARVARLAAGVVRT